MTTKYVPVPKCGCCGKKAWRVWQNAPTPDNENDCFAECDTCINYLCKNCTDEDEDTGITTCTNCLQTAAVRKYNLSLNTKNEG